MPFAFILECGWRCIIYCGFGGIYCLNYHVTSFLVTVLSCRVFVFCCAVSLIDVGVVTSNIFLSPIRKRIDDCTMNQVVVAVLFGAVWRQPHFAENDAQMCLDSLEGILTELEVACRQKNPAPVGL